MTGDLMTTSSPALVRRRISDAVYDALLDAVVSGRLAAGTKIKDRDLCAELRVSRTPVREALQRMEDAGLIDIASGQHTEVTGTDRAQVEVITLLASQTCALAAERAIGTMTAKDFESLERETAAAAWALSAGNTAELIRASIAFYTVFVDASGNPVLSRTFGRLWPHVAREITCDSAWRYPPDLVQRRQEIASAAQSGDGRRTADLIRAAGQDLAARVASRARAS
jgi:DNA-binding GntR family transcriptional regulator